MAKKLYTRKSERSSSISKIVGKSEGGKYYTRQGSRYIQVRGRFEAQNPEYAFTTATERALNMSLPPDLRNRPVSEVQFIINQRSSGLEPTATEIALKQSLPPELRNRSVSEVQRIQRQERFEPTATEVALKQSLPPELRNRSVSEVQRIQRQERFQGKEGFRDRVAGDIREGIKIGRERSEQRFAESQQSRPQETIGIGGLFTMPQTSLLGTPVAKGISKGAETVTGGLESLAGLLPETTEEKKTKKLLDERQKLVDRLETLQGSFETTTFTEEGAQQAREEQEILLKKIDAIDNKIENVRETIPAGRRVVESTIIGGARGASQILTPVELIGGKSGTAGAIFEQEKRETVEAFKQRPLESISSTAGTLGLTYGLGKGIGAVGGKILPEPPTRVVLAETKPGTFLEVAQKGKAEGKGAGVFFEVEEFAFGKPGKKSTPVELKITPLKSSITEGKFVPSKIINLKVPSGKEALFEDIYSRPRTDRFLLLKQTTAEAGKRTAKVQEALFVAKDLPELGTEGREFSLGVRETQFFKGEKLKEQKIEIVEPDITPIGQKYVLGGIDKPIKGITETEIAGKNIRITQELNPFKEGTFEVQQAGITTTDLGGKPKTTTGTALFRRAGDNLDQFRIKTLQRPPQEFESIFKDIEKGNFQQQNIGKEPIEIFGRGKPSGTRPDLFKDLPKFSPRLETTKPIKDLVVKTKATTARPTPRSGFTGTVDIFSDLQQPFAISPELTIVGAKPSQFVQPSLKPSSSLDIFQEPKLQPSQRIIQEPATKIIQEPVSKVLQEPKSKLFQQPVQDPVQKVIQRVEQQPIQKVLQRPVTKPFETLTTIPRTPLGFDFPEEDFFNIKKSKKKGKKEQASYFIPNIIGLEESFQTDTFIKEPKGTKTFFGFEKRLATKKPLSISPFQGAGNIFSTPGKIFKQQKKKKKRKIKFPF